MLESLNYSFTKPKKHILSDLPHQTVEKLQNNHGVLRGPQLGKQLWRARLGILRVKYSTTWSSHLNLGLPTGLDEHGSHSVNFLTAIFASILITCPAQRNLCDFIHLTIFLLIKTKIEDIFGFVYLNIAHRNYKFNFRSFIRFQTHGLRFRCWRTWRWWWLYKENYLQCICYVFGAKTKSCRPQIYTRKGGGNSYDAIADKTGHSLLRTGSRRFAPQ